MKVCFNGFHFVKQLNSWVYAYTDNYNKTRRFFLLFAFVLIPDTNLKEMNYYQGRWSDNHFKRFVFLYFVEKVSQVLH